MCKVLGDHGFDNCKMFVYGHSLGPAQRWGWHVAPLVVVDDRGPALKVVDPSIAKLPIPPAEWLDTVDSRKGPLTIRVADRANYGRDDTTTRNFDASLPSARTTLWNESGGHFHLLEFLAGHRADPPIEMLDGIPSTVDGETMIVTFPESSAEYRIGTAEQLQVLQAAMNHGRRVRVTAFLADATIVHVQA